MRVKGSVNHTANTKRDRMDVILLSSPCVQARMTRLTIETGLAFLCRPAKLVFQWIIDLLTGTTALYTEPFEDGRSAY